MRANITAWTKTRRKRSLAGFGITLALALVIGVTGPGAPVASATLAAPGDTTTCVQPGDVRIIFIRTAGSADLDDLLADCMPQVVSPVGVPMSESPSLEDPPAPPTVDDTVVPSNLAPRLDNTIVGVADNSNTIRPMPENECYAGWRFDITKKLASRFAPGNNRTYTYINGSDRVQENALSATRTQRGSVGMSATAEVEVEAGVIVSSVKAKFGVTVSGEIGWEQSITTGASVGPRKAGHLTWGVWRYVTVGHYYHVDCSGNTNIDKGTITVYSPWSEAAYYYEESI